MQQGTLAKLASLTKKSGFAGLRCSLLGSNFGELFFRVRLNATKFVCKNHTKKKQNFQQVGVLVFPKSSFTSIGKSILEYFCTSLCTIVREFGWIPYVYGHLGPLDPCTTTNNTNVIGFVNKSSTEPGSTNKINTNVIDFVTESALQVTHQKIFVW